MSDSEQVLGIDIGGTGIKAAPVNIELGKIMRVPLRISTPKEANPACMLPALQKIVEHFRWKNVVGCGFPGVIKQGKVFTAANLSQEWIGVDLKARIEQITSHTVRVLNDADAAALAEMCFGVGKPYNKHGGGVVLIITLGTGIGSALFVDGHLVPNTEFGHIEMDGMDAEDLAATVIREQDNLSWQEWGARVNKYLQMMELLVAPDLIIIGGGVSQNPELFFPYLHLKAKLVAAEMGNDAGIVGAALAFNIEY